MSNLFYGSILCANTFVFWQEMVHTNVKQNNVSLHPMTKYFLHERYTIPIKSTLTFYHTDKLIHGVWYTCINHLNCLHSSIYISKINLSLKHVDITNDIQ